MFIPTDRFIIPTGPIKIPSEAAQAHVFVFVIKVVETIILSSNIIFLGTVPQGVT